MHILKIRLLPIAAAALAAVSLRMPAQVITLNGAGATFPAPIYNRWFSEYGKTHPGVKFSYQAVGSGAGIKLFSEGKTDFGATDGPMTDAELAAAKVKSIRHLPMVMGAVVPVFNLQIPGIRFSGRTLAAIFLGDVKNWNDPLIAKDNPGITVPAGPITVVHRADGSGTTYCFTDFLAKTSTEWKRRIGAPANSVNWPADLAGTGNEGVAEAVRKAPGAIGYMELIYAVHYKIKHGAVKNRAGEYIVADMSNVSAAAVTASIPADYRVSITDAPANEAYPISTFTWLLVPGTTGDAKKDAALREFLRWAVTEGQKFAEPLGYAPLPPDLARRELAELRKQP